VITLKQVKRRLPVVLLGTGAVAGLVLLVAKAFAVPVIWHDDAVSYLSATGHQAAFEIDPELQQWTANAAGQWVDARLWQSLWQPDAFGKFRTIAADLARHDLHPPAYFWLLHVWCHLCGTRVITGPTLNLSILLLTALMMLPLCRTLSQGSWTSAVAGVLWLLSGPTLSLVVETRQYSLLSFASVAFLLALVFFLRNPSRRSVFLLGAVTALGMLTHYHFVLLLCIGSFAAAIQLAFSNRGLGALALLCLSLCIGGLVFYLLHPDFYLSIARQTGSARQTLVPLGLAERLTRCLRAPLESIMPADTAYNTATRIVRHRWSSFACVSLLASTTVLSRRARKCLMRFSLSTEALPTIAVVVMTLALWLLYLLGVSPRHAMGAKYFVLVAPLLFVVLAQCLSLLERPRPTLSVVCFFIILSFHLAHAISSTVDYTHAARQRVADAHSLNASGGPIVLDSVSRGVVPVVLWNVLPDTPVYAAWQQDLLKKLPNPPLPETNRVLYVSVLANGNTPAGRDEILQAFAARGLQTDAPGRPLLGVGTVYELARRTLSQNDHTPMSVGRNE